VHCTVHILLFIVKAYPRIPCFIMTNEVIIRCQKHQRLVYGAYPRTPTYPQYAPGTNQKFGGLGQDLGGLCPPGPSLKSPLLSGAMGAGSLLTYTYLITRLITRVNYLPSRSNSTSYQAPLGLLANIVRSSTQ